MIFNAHSSLEGTHSFLSPSSHAWLKYSDDKLIDRYNTHLAAQEGTELHALAKTLIEKKIKVQRIPKTFYMYVNDAIGFGMIPEQILVYSEFCYGTADSILYSEKKRFLRIHDLKTGVIPASMDQLRIYDALFFLEYGQKLGITPFDVGIENRIYQSNNVAIDNPEPNDIKDIMQTIIHADEVLKRMNMER